MNSLKQFLQHAKHNPQIGPIHIALYAALLATHTPSAPFRVDRPTLMQLSKLSSRSAYYKALSVLSSSGYIQYSPNNTPGRTSITLFTFPPHPPS